MMQEAHSLVLWTLEGSEPACKIGIAGDFLPSYLHSGQPAEAWKNKASLMSPIFDDLAVTILNFEGTVGTDGLEPFAKPGAGDILHASPDCLAYLKELRVGIVGVANNHIFDYREEGAWKTVQWLSTMQLLSIGFALSTLDSPQTHVWQGPDGIKVGVWAATRISYSPAGKSSAGVESATIKRAEEAIEQIRSKGASVCVAFLHAGMEKTNHPDPEDVAMMRELRSIGFDVVAACHSHRIAGHEQASRAGGITPAFSFYGLGSLASGIVYSPLEREGLVVVLGISASGRLCSVEVRPVLLDQDGWGIVPCAAESREILNRFHQLSRHIADGSYRKMFYHDMSEGLLRRQWHDLRTAWLRGGAAGVMRKLGRFKWRHVRSLYQKLAGGETQKSQPSLPPEVSH